MKYTKSNNKYYLKLDAGEDVFGVITDFVKSKKIISGSFSAIGAFDDPEVAYYTRSIKDYTRKKFDGLYELASLNGNIGLVDGEQTLHIHVVLIKEGHIYRV